MVFPTIVPTEQHCELRTEPRSRSRRPATLGERDQTLLECMAFSWEKARHLLLAQGIEAIVDSRSIGEIFPDSHTVSQQIIKLVNK